MNKQSLESEEIDGFLYEVYYDEDGFYNAFESNGAIEFESEEERESYKQKFINEELDFFSVHKFKKCKGCERWEEVEALYGIEAETSSEALKHYLSNYL